MTETTVTFTPTQAAWELYQTFRPRSAGADPRATAFNAATTILWAQPEPGQAALIRYYARRLPMVTEARTPRPTPLHPWDEAHRQLVLDTHRETLRCLMVMLLAARNINPDKIAPADYPALAAIAVANVKDSH